MEYKTEPQQLITSTDALELIDVWREKFGHDIDLYERKFAGQREKAVRKIKKFKRDTLDN